MTKTTDESPALKRISWVIWGVMAALLIALGSAFFHAWQMNQVLQAKVKALEPLLTASWDQQATLQAQLAYVQSDAYVEEWSRTHAGMTQPGDTLVVPIIPTPTPTPTPMPTPVSTPTPTPQYFWERWWRAIVGPEK